LLRGWVMRATVRSRRLGARLSRYRAECGLSGAQLARELNVGQPQLSRMENGKAKVTPAALARLVEVLGIPEADARKLDELRRRSAEPGWWQDYGDILSEPATPHPPTTRVPATAQRPPASLAATRSPGQ
jgi:transcriptional regulator with XRE-family HTH domain